jgi:hypothetical protein
MFAVARTDNWLLTCPIESCLIATARREQNAPAPHRFHFDAREQADGLQTREASGSRVFSQGTNSG